MRTLYLDCVGGVAGDMLLAALIDAGAALDTVRAGLPVAGLELDAERVERAGTPARLLTVRGGASHTQRSWRDVHAILEAGQMPARARECAHAAFARLAEAEATVHGVEPDEVTFHEVGSLDAIADICGVVLALEDLGIERVVCSPLPLGRGSTTGAHGVLPLPAPATLELLRGTPVHGTDIPGETVTPTAAALVATLASSYGPLPAMRLRAVGTGAGRRNPAEVPNVVRALVGEVSEPSEPATGEFVQLETNLDDLVGELVPDAVEACLAAGALDAWTAPITMKHGRPGIVFSVLAGRSAEQAVAEAVLRHTSALGLRVRPVPRRWELDREWSTVTVAGYSIAVKLGLLDGQIVNVAPEHRDCAAVAAATGRSVKSVWAAALAAAHRAGETERSSF